MDFMSIMMIIYGENFSMMMKEESNADLIISILEHQLPNQFENPTKKAEEYHFRIEMEKFALPLSHTIQNDNDFRMDYIYKYK